MKVTQLPTLASDSDQLSVGGIDRTGKRENREQRTEIDKYKV